MPFLPPHVASSSTIIATATTNTSIDVDEEITMGFGPEWKTGDWCWEDQLPDDKNRCTGTNGDSLPRAIKNEEGEREESKSPSIKTDDIGSTSPPDLVPSSSLPPPPAQGLEGKSELAAEIHEASNSPKKEEEPSVSPTLSSAQGPGVKPEVEAETHRAASPKKEEEQSASSSPQTAPPLPPSQGPEVYPGLKKETNHATESRKKEEEPSAEENAEWTPGCFCWLPDPVASGLDAPERRKRKQVPVEADGAEEEDLNPRYEDEDFVPSTAAAMSNKKITRSNKKLRKFRPQLHRAAVLKSSKYRNDYVSDSESCSDDDATFVDVSSESDHDSLESIFQPKDTRNETNAQSLSLSSAYASQNSIEYESKPWQKEWLTTSNKKWEIMYQRLVEYKQKHGTTCVPQQYKADPKLANWVRHQRAHCKKEDRIDLLNQIGFVWKLRNCSYWGDEAWEKMYQRLVEYKQKHGTTQVPFNYKADPQLGNWVSKQRIGCKRKDRIGLLNQIGFVWKHRNHSCWDDEAWENMYQRLVEYKQKHGTTCVPANYKADPKLGHWVRTQRTCCKREDRIDLLNQIGFVWKLRNGSYKDDEAWEDTYQRLVEYKQKHGTTQVPRNYKADPKLGNWVKHQRKHCKRKDHIDLLNQIGFVWNGDQRVDEAWDIMYQRLVEYKQKHGTTCVPYIYIADPKLGNWVHEQRRSCKRKDRIGLLNQIGFVWNGDQRGDEGWENMYQRLVEYKQKHGTTQVPRNNNADPKLGNWVQSQRRSCKRKDRIGWENMYQRLVEYKQKHGTTSVPFTYKEDPKLGRWVMSQRMRCKRKDRIDLLNQIGFVWKVKDANNWDDEGWENMYQGLVEYKQKHGTTQVPPNYKADPKLGNWVQRQRICCKRKDRVDLLNQIGFVWEVMCANNWDEGAWDRMYQCLVEYKQKHGTTQVPRKYKADPKLGEWVRTQRKFCKRKDRVDRLNQIGFVWKGGYIKVYDDETHKSCRSEDYTNCLNQSEFVWKVQCANECNDK
ncbi:unnamed protein product [Pseudo-nitzschia multistriata]|uniref:Helicase-associated domain-containing protein n=1 Tax=Pseudo-nitzschia multistriata TaxID=183589 RepID=A0A448ZEH4_9STRA|nr:unnamed protein product [Pseudo-nitzschia multistriata]